MHDRLRAGVPRGARDIPYRGVGRLLADVWDRLERAHVLSHAHAWPMAASISVWRVLLFGRGIRSQVCRGRFKRNGWIICSVHATG